MQPRAQQRSVSALREPQGQERLDKRTTRSSDRYGDEMHLPCWAVSLRISGPHLKIRKTTHRFSGNK